MSTETVKLIKSHRHRGVDYVCDKKTPHHELKATPREKAKLQRAKVIETKAKA